MTHNLHLSSLSSVETFLSSSTVVMRKRAAALPPPLLRHFLRGLKGLLLVSPLLLTFAFLQRYPSSTGFDLPLPAPPFSGTPKVAFVFLARAHLPLDFLWHAFFQKADPAHFSIYVHSAPAVVFDSSTTSSRFFYGRELENSVQVMWGEASMIEAERLLFKAALEDPANQRFVLLSDSCVPLYNFTYIYGYLMSSSKSFVDIFLNPDDRRYNPKMSSVISREKWRKGSQWITLIRKHAEVLVSDHTVFSAFKKHCKRRPDPDFDKRRNPVEDYCANLLSDLAGNKLLSSIQECVERTLSFYALLLDQETNCIPDEHYVQTLFAMAGIEGELERRALTYTSWNQTTDGMKKQGWHPQTFNYDGASPQHIDEIKDINHVYYETEHRTEWCRSNSTSVPCFLFARKFSKGAALRMLNDGLFGQFDQAEFLSSFLDDQTANRSKL